MSELELEGHLIQLRALLNERKIKLWETPYLTPERQPEDGEIRKLAETLGTELAIPIALCTQGLIALQRNALEKLQSKDEFQKTGVATIKVRAPTQTASNREFDLKLKVTETGSQLCEMIAGRLSLDPRKIKLVCAGRIVNGARTLQEQKMTNGVVVMALVMAQCKEEVVRECSTYDRVHKIRMDAELLINENDSSNFLSIEDQSGNAIFLPKHEKKALLMGLTLYEKGKVAIRAENYEEALLLLLEADSDFCSCNSQLLNVVDNYALLNLDIVWCYLCLKNFNQLPDAELRLKVCEEKFRQSYGMNMQRVTAIRGEQSNEKTLLVRLHLLKAVLFFHQNRRDDARTMFRVVETELMKLRVDDSCLSRLMECGYSIKECRIALRACTNDVEAAIEFIQNRRQTLEANEKRSERERKLYTMIGHDMSDGERQRLKLEHVDQLMEMGYPEALAALALQRHDNDINEALNELGTNREGLQNKLLHTNEALQQQLIGQGFTPQVVLAVMKMFANDYDRATQYLSANVQNGQYSDALMRAIAEMGHGGTGGELSAERPSSHTDPKPSSSRKSSVVVDDAKQEEKRRKKEMLDILFKSFSQDIKSSADSYLDLTLNEETNMLEQYKTLLGMD